MLKLQNSNGLSRTTCFRILKACPALYKKCLLGLDNTMASGSSAFAKLKNVLDELAFLGLNEKIQNESLDSLNSSKNNLKYN